MSVLPGYERDPQKKLEISGKQLHSKFSSNSRRRRTKFSIFDNYWQPALQGKDFFFPTPAQPDDIALANQLGYQHQHSKEKAKSTNK
jgi:hypothetical protein